MKTTIKKATIHIDKPLHRVLRKRAIYTDRTISEMASEAIRRALAEDAEDLAAFEERAHEKGIPLSTAIKKLKQDGKL